MSYSQTFTARIRIHGSTSVDYPASQNGGSKSASYTAEEDVNITLLVDTDRFDRNVHGCNATIDGLGGAVAVMNAAQCMEIAENARTVSSTVVNGFFNLIRSELTQQMTDMKNRSEAQELLLLQLGKRIKEAQAITQRDYSLISSKYRDVFQELDKECYRRVRALDDSSFDLAERALRSSTLGALLSSAGAAMVLARDIPGKQNFILGSRLRSRVLVALHSLAAHVAAQEKLKADCESAMFDKAAPERREYFSPCLAAEWDNLEVPGSSRRVAAPGGLAVEAGILESAIFGEGSCLAWLPLDDAERGRIGAELEKLIEAANAAEPVPPSLPNGAAGESEDEESEAGPASSAPGGAAASGLDSPDAQARILKYMGELWRDDSPARMKA